AAGEAREDLARAEKAAGELSTRRATLAEAIARLDESAAEEGRLLAEAQSALEGAPDPGDIQSRFERQSTLVAEDRSALADARALDDGLKREAEARQRRLTAIAQERQAWIARAENADRQKAALIERRGEAADALAVAETRQAELDKAANAALQALSESREARGRAEERLTAAEERRRDAEARIQEALGIAPHLVFRQTGLGPDDPLPEMGDVERRVDRLKVDRERLGAVNLRAEEEQRELAERLETIVTEREDVIEAIKKLRLAIQSLNREGRERLLEAFDRVNAQFQRLFTHLFGGGTAELQLVESDDPLEAGLEILARPPGKKPQTMTLRSGGAQALTAMALIFAVFLTNPAPICVLDEVDAPLDDHNVERFCNLMDEMAASTQTRFVIITHNPITMARMNRLFGVTMAEQGVSQLVSVDLQTAEQIREAS
ncbi:MAG: chromosome segregation protein SMC, partial [Nitratireductor sp.]